MHNRVLDKPLLYCIHFPAASNSLLHPIPYSACLKSAPHPQTYPLGGDRKLLDRQVQQGTSSNVSRRISRKSSRFVCVVIAFAIVITLIVAVVGLWYLRST